MSLGSCVGTRERERARAGGVVKDLFNRESGFDEELIERERVCAELTRHWSRESGVDEASVERERESGVDEVLVERERS